MRDPRPRPKAPPTPATGLGLLTVLFIGLKLTGHIAWPWVWVLVPLWGPVALAALLVALVKLRDGMVPK